MAGDYSNTFDLKAELAILESRLEFPSKHTLRPFFEKLLENPGSCIVLTLEAPRGPEGPYWKIGWLSSAERDAVRKEIVKINAKRTKKGHKLTSDAP